MIFTSDDSRSVINYINLYKHFKKETKYCSVPCITFFKIALSDIKLNKIWKLKFIFLYLQWDLCTVIAVFSIICSVNAVCLFIRHAVTVITSQTLKTLCNTTMNRYAKTDNNNL